jgi:hypothetical protein
MSLNDQNQNPLSSGDTNSFGGTVDDLDLDGPLESDSIGYELEDEPEDNPKDEPVPEPEDKEEIPEPKKKDEGEPEPEPEPKPDEEEDEPEPVNNRVPVKRLNKEIEKRRAAEEQFAETNKQMEELRKQIAEFTSQQSKTEDVPEIPKVNMTERMKEILNQTLDGDVDNSAAAMAAIFEQMQTEAMTQAEERAAKSYESKTNMSNQERMLLDEADKIVKEYSVYDNSSDDFDAGIAEETVELRDAFIAAGYESHAALRKAADMTMKIHGYGKGESTPAPEPKPTSKKPTQKNVEAAATTPPRQQGELDTQRKLPSVEEMTEAEFDALSDAELAKLRGDFDF